MIRHRYSRFNEDLADDYINLSTKTNKQNNNIEGILQKDYEKFENGIKLKAEFRQRLKDAGVW